MAQGERKVGLGRLEHAKTIDVVQAGSGNRAEDFRERIGQTRGRGSDRHLLLRRVVLGEIVRLELAGRDRLAVLDTGEGDGVAEARVVEGEAAASDRARSPAAPDEHDERRDRDGDNQEDALRVAVGGNDGVAGRRADRVVERKGDGIGEDLGRQSRSRIADARSERGSRRRGTPGVGPAGSRTRSHCVVSELCKVARRTRRQPSRRRYRCSRRRGRLR